MKRLRANASRSIAARPPIGNRRCATPPANTTRPITGSTAISLMCSAALRNATSSTPSRKPPTTRSTAAHRRRAGEDASHILARVVGRVALPLLHERFELGIALVGQHDAHGDKQIAAAGLCRKALALETKGPSARSPGRNRDLD